MTTPELEQAVSEIWELFRETDMRMKETDKFMKETAERMRETDARLTKHVRETDVRLDKHVRETDDQIRETSAAIRRAEALFTSQWGKFIETLVRADAVRLFQARSIPVCRLFPRAKSQLNGNSMEIDLLLENDDIAIVIEVKSTLKVEDVRYFLTKMARFLEFFPRYHTYRVYGGVAGLDIVEDADKFAYRQGLFVLTMAGEGPVVILNDAAFQPRDFRIMGNE